MLLAALVGLGFGASHVLAGPDHLAAVAPIAGRSASRGAWVGVRWALGHSGGVALAALAARWVLDAAAIEGLSSWSERLVGVALVALGLWGFYRATKRATPDPSEPLEAARAHAHLRTAFGFGALHGLAGSSHLLGVLPALAQPTSADALAYLAGFALGTVLAMASFSAALGWSASRARPHWRARLEFAACGASVAVGAWWLSA